MKSIRLLFLLLLAVALPIILLTYDRLGISFFDHQPAAPKTSKPTQAELETRHLNEGLQAFTQAYQQEFTRYQQQIENQWGEFKQAAPSIWLSYEEAGTFRRTVDYNQGEVRVEMMIDQETPLEQVKGQVDQAVYRLMNTTQKQAYATDVVSNRVEHRLTAYEDILQKGEMTDERLFSMNDFLSLRIPSDGFVKVWYQSGNVAVTNIVPAAKAGKEIVRVSFRIPYTMHQKAVKFAAQVKAAAAKEQINAELIYAIMETESGFNPMAKSYIPAYGLMQIVPRTAGKDATSYLYGKARLLAPSYLYKPKNNISIGAAYLHVLQYRYMRKVKNKQSRIYCAIAAYNTGTSNVAKAFIDQASFNKAVAEINKLSPSQVYQKLKKYLPHKEARQYVEKVSKRMRKYL